MHTKAAALTESIAEQAGRDSPSAEFASEHLSPLFENVRLTQVLGDNAYGGLKSPIKVAMLLACSANVGTSLRERLDESVVVDAIAGQHDIDTMCQCVGVEKWGDCIRLPIQWLDGDICASVFGVASLGLLLPFRVGRGHVGEHVFLEKLERVLLVGQDNALNLRRKHTSNKPRDSRTEF